MRAKRWWIGGALAALGVVFVAAASGVLPGSPSLFESDDGNQIVNTLGNHDWANVAFTHLTDPAATTQDDSWPNGTKMDSQCVQVANNKNPGKDDFTDIASYSETAANGNLFVYGATIRVAPNGNASTNVELNKVAGTAACPINRTQGDKLLAFDYKQGGTVLDLHVLTFVNGPGFSDAGGSYAGTCIVSNDSPPCWSSTVITPSAGSFEGAVNQAPISAADNPISGVALAAGTFAEFGVNLTAAIGVSGNACNPFHQTDWESRSAGSSFSSNPQDIKIQSNLGSNCGTITIIKHTNPGGLDQNFSYTSNIPGTGNASFTLNDAATDTRVMTDVQQGSYTVTEAVPPANFALESLTCTATGGSSGSQNSTILRQADIVLTGGGSVTCTYVNKQQLGAIRLTKVSAKGSAALAGAQFTYTGADNVAHDFPLTGADGTACVDGLTFGTYSVAETSAPSGYLGDPTPQNVTVSASGTCDGSGGPATTPTNNFVNTPLSTITVGFHSLAGPGVTSATVQCTGEVSAANLPEGDATKTLGNGTTTLTPGTYSCTIVVDP